jgi:hypothetical protein
MRTITIQVKHEAVLRLLEDLAKLNLVKIISKGVKNKKELSLSSRMAGSISNMQADTMANELKEMRNEWGRDI